jgi:hypothetical protein
LLATTRFGLTQSKYGAWLQATTLRSAACCAKIIQARLLGINFSPRQPKYPIQSLPCAWALNTVNILIACTPISYLFLDIEPSQPAYKQRGNEPQPMAGSIYCRNNCFFTART